MLISFDYLLSKYKMQIKGILHVGMHEAEEIDMYEKCVGRDKILWVEAMLDKVQFCRTKFPGILVENAVVSDSDGEDVRFNVSNNGQSSSILNFGTHKINHPEVHYIYSFQSKTKRLENVISKYKDSINFNFLNLDIQGVELKALKGLGDYLENIDYIYTEVNCDYVYEKCDLVTDIDDYLSGFGFKRVETSWFGSCKWGDAFYIK
jgi:FkbM family methyltransferase